jgi:hypothetical protein
MARRCGRAGLALLRRQSTRRIELEIYDEELICFICFK